MEFTEDGIVFLIHPRYMLLYIGNVRTFFKLVT